MPDERTCANPILLQFVKEWMDDAQERNNTVYVTYKKAYDSLKVHPNALRHPCEFIKVANIGKTISARLTIKYQKYCEENNIPIPEVPRGKPRKRPANAAVGGGDNPGNNDDEDAPAPPPKRPRKQKPYVPAYRSGPYALLLALYEEQLVRGSPVGGIMTKQQLIDAAQKYCDSSFTAPSDPGKWYTAWAGMKVLTGKDLVWERGKPRKYSLSDTGEEVARGIMLVQRMREGGGQVEEAEEEEERGDSEVALLPPPNATGNENRMRKGKEKEKEKEKEDIDAVVAKAPAKRKGKATTKVTMAATAPAGSSTVHTGATKFSSPFNGFDSTIVIDDDGWVELFEKPINSHPQFPRSSSSTNWLDGIENMTGTTMGKSPTTRASESKSITTKATTKVNDEDDIELKRRLRIAAIEQRLSGVSTSSGAAQAPPSSPPIPPLAQPPRPAPASPPVTKGSTKTNESKKSNFFDLTLSSPTSSPLSSKRSELLLSSPPPLTSRSLNLNTYQPLLFIDEADKLPSVSTMRKPLVRSTSQQQPASRTRAPLAKSASAVASSASTSLLSKPTITAATAPLAPIFEPLPILEAVGPATSSAISPIPTPWLPGTFTIHLILDSREVRSKTDRTYLQTELTTRGVTPITRPLHLGDALWIARHNTSGKELVLDYIIERKRMDDLVGSIKDGRFHEQKWRLSRSGVKNIIYLIEDLGNWAPGGANGGGQDDGGQHMRDAVNTAISSTQVVNGFFLKRTSKVDDSIRYLARMHNFLAKLYGNQTLYPIPSHLLCSRTYISGLKPNLAEMYKGKDFYPEYDAWNELVDKSAHLTHRDVFLKMLMCIRGVSAEKAIEIQRVWKTPGEFLEAFERCATEEERWGMVMNGVGARGVGRKRIGGALSRKVCEVWWGEGE